LKNWKVNFISVLLGIVAEVLVKQICEFHIVTSVVIGVGIFYSARFFINYILFPQDEELRRLIIKKLIGVFVFIFTLLHSDNYEEHKLKVDNGNS